MKVQFNGMTYDDSDPRCTTWIASTQATMGLSSEVKTAFVTCVDDSTQIIKRYWGVWSTENQAQSMLDILQRGGKWPVPFRDVGLSGEKID